LPAQLWEGPVNRCGFFCELNQALFCADDGPSA
jgi:hypothetical protein